MKITHIIERLDVGGAQVLLSNLLPVIGQKKDVKVSIVVYQSVKDSVLEQSLRESPYVRFVNLDLKRTRDFSPVFRLVSEVREADIVHAHLYPALYHVAMAGLVAGTPVIYTEHSVTNNRRQHKWLRPVERMIYSLCAGIIAVSSEVAEALEQWAGVDKDKIRVIPNGIKVGDYQCVRPHESQWSSIFGRGGKAILMPARFVKAKDHATVIRAVPYLKDKDAFIAFAGDGETKREMQALAESLGVSDRVVFLGNRDDIPHLLSAAEVGVLSSHWEGQGISVLEMMAAGVPTVVNDLPVLRDLVGDAGRCFPSGDERALAGILDDILSRNTRNDADNSECLRARARRYDIGAVAESYLDYLSLIRP